MWHKGDRLILSPSKDVTSARPRPSSTSSQARAPNSWWARVGWFVLFWAAGVVTVAAVGYAIKLVLL